MTVVIRMKKREELKALPILFRHSAGVILRRRTYILSEGAVRALREKGILFTELSRLPGSTMKDTSR
jgi:hypothetical protein